MPLPVLNRARREADETLGRRPWLALALALLLAAAVAAPVVALDLHGRHDRPDSPPTGGAPRVTVLDALAKITTPPSPLQRAVARLTTARKVAQLFAVGFAGTDGSAPIVGELRRRGWGTVVLQQGNVVSDIQLIGLIAALQASAQRGRQVGLLVAAAQEGGARRAIVDRPPRAQPEVARGGVRAVRREARFAGEVLRRLGIRMTFAPLADVAAEGGPYVPRSFGVDAGFVARATTAAVKAYLRAGVIPAVGSFPGAGGAAQDPEAGPAPVGLSLPELQRRDLRPFRAIAARAPVIVLSNATYAAFDGVTPASVLPRAVSLLRRDLGFEGVVMSGDLVATTATTATSIRTAAVDSFKAGADMLYVPGAASDQEAAYQGVLSAVRAGTISRARLDASVTRILALKRRFGIAR